MYNTNMKYNLDKSFDIKHWINIKGFTTISFFLEAI